MKYLYLLRHADAAWGAKGSKDLTRTLSPKGHEQCLEVAAHFTKQRITPDLVLCSTATRVTQTYNNVSQALNAAWSVTESALLYLCNNHQLLEEIQFQDDASDRLLIIGHNPTFQEIIWLLSKRSDRETLEDIERGFPPASLASLSFDCNSWSDVDKGKGQITNLFKTK